MDFQLIAAALIILAAVFYVGVQVWRKAKSFSPRSSSSCASDCGCDTSGKTAKSYGKI